MIIKTFNQYFVLDSYRQFEFCTNIQLTYKGGTNKHYIFRVFSSSLSHNCFFKYVENRGLTLSASG